MSNFTTFYKPKLHLKLTFTLSSDLQIFTSSYFVLGKGRSIVESKRLQGETCLQHGQEKKCPQEVSKP